MITYLASGYSDLSAHPVPIMKRRVWEIYVVAEGEVAPDFADGRPHDFRHRYVWVMPPGLAYGWRATPGRVKRYVMHLTSVPLAMKMAGGDRGFFARRISRHEVLEISTLYHVLDTHSLSCTSVSTLHADKACPAVAERNIG